MKVIGVVITAMAMLATATRTPYPVCIVGAGPAGLSAASMLESKGHETVIFEKQASVGGKCQAYYENDVFHPLGALLFTNETYRETLKIIQATGVSSIPFLDSLPKWIYDWRNGVVTPAPIPTEAFEATLASEVQSYIEFWNNEFGAKHLTSIGYKGGVPEALTVPTSQWLMENNYTALPVIINGALVTFGYGDLREIPILYSLQLFAPDVLNGYLNSPPGYLIDYHEVFTRFSKTIKGPINLNVSINAIDRKGDFPTITWGTSYPPSPELQIQTCSALILAFPPTFASLVEAGFLPSVNEYLVFGPVITSNYYSAAVQMNPAIPPQALYAANASGPAVPPEPDAEPVNFIRLWNNSAIVTSWSWGGYDSLDNTSSTQTAQSVQQLLETTLSKVNKNPADLSAQPTPVTDEDVTAFTKQLYFPHFLQDELRNGWYQKLASLQGQLKTYYASGLNGFESVEFAVRAGQDVVESYF